MPENSEIIIPDTSCLILLSKFEEIELLRDFGRPVYVTPAISSEYEKNLPDWIKIRPPEDNHYQKILEMDLDAGEASAIALCIELEKSVIIIDDLKGRKICSKLDLKYSGTFGLILAAKRKGIIDSVKPILKKIKNTNLRFDQNLFDTIMRLAGEK